MRGLSDQAGREFETDVIRWVAVDDVAPEHIYLSMLELFRRRQSRAREDLRPKFIAQLIAAVEASGLTNLEYMSKVQTKDDEATALLEEALAELDQKLAKQEALVRAYEASGKSLVHAIHIGELCQRFSTGLISAHQGFLFG